MTPADLEPVTLGQVGDTLRRAGYGTQGDNTRVENPARDLLWALFDQSTPVALGEVTAHCEPDLPELLARSGLVVLDGARLVPRVRIVRWCDLFVAGDLKGADSLHDDAVFAVSGTTSILENLRLDRPVKHALDLGCGSGALALRMASLADKVTATDINARAVAFSRSNAALNRIETVAVDRGSLYDPLQGEAVDLILGNLPFVLSPEQRLLYRDGNKPTEELVTEAVLGAAEHLKPGGVAQFTCNWPIRDPDAEEWVRDLAARTGIDMLAIEYRRRTPLDHTRNWNRPARATDPEVQLELEQRWTDWFKAQEIDHIGFGVLTLRRPATARSGRFSYFVADRLPEAGGGRQVDRMLRALDAPLTRNSVPGPVPHVVFQQLVHDGSGYDAMPAEIFSAESAGICLTVPPDAIATIMAVDGCSNVAEIVGPDGSGYDTLDEAYRRGLVTLD
ncbi:methyltransferase [Aliiruegeria sabulilitoris]|uniref:methyltransferase n=1 Tax=Aliiruegeria sabulilitoris TaxID=1510458 RepID=UPI0013D1A18C|nr:methyltransferase [Aliiruegeria sabulilitoris]